MNLPRTLHSIESGMHRGLHIGAQLYVCLRGEVVADVAFGQSGRGQAMRPDTLMLWLSAGKPLLAVLVGQLWEQSLLDLDDRVARFVPEFGVRGKEPVTLRHLLTHTGGFRGVANTWSSGTWAELVSRICGAPLEANWVPGRTAGYHVASSWIIPAEIVQRISSLPLPELARRQLFDPIGMNQTHYTLSDDEYRRLESQLGVMQDTATSSAAPQRSGLPRIVGKCCESSDGRDGSPSRPGAPHNGGFAETALPSAEIPGTPQRFDTAANAGKLRPAGNIRGPIRELGLFYRTMLDGGVTPGGRRVLRAETVEALTTRQRAGMMDRTFGRMMDWGLGFMVNSATAGQAPLPYSFGPHAGSRAFGHGGSQSSVGMADPEHGLVAAIVFNGMCGEEAHTARIHEVLGAVYEDLDLAGSGGTIA